MLPYREFMEGIHAFRQMYHGTSLWGALRTISSIRKTFLPFSKSEVACPEAIRLLSRTAVNGTLWDGNTHECQFRVKLEAERVTFTLENFTKRKHCIFQVFKIQFLPAVNEVRNRIMLAKGCCIKIHANFHIVSSYDSYCSFIFILKCLPL